MSLLIRSIYRTLGSLAESQRAVVGAFADEERAIQSENGKLRSAVQGHVQTLVVTGDNARYAALTAAAKAAGLAQDFTAEVRQSTQKDLANRKERAELEAAWGTKQQIADKARVVAGQLSEHNTAIADISKEVTTFDGTTQKINAHNEKYPKAQINAENNGQYDLKGWKKFVAFINVFNRGPWRAYKVIKEYKEQYGDYYEDAATISSKRANEKNLRAEAVELNKSHAALQSTLQRMNALDASYLGPEGIARNVRAEVESLVFGNKKFAFALCGEISAPAAKETVLCLIKMEKLDALRQSLAAPAKAAQKTLKSLQGQLGFLEDAVSTVGNESIRFFTGDIEDAVAKAAVPSREAVQLVKAARLGIVNYTGTADLAEAERTLQDFTKVKTPDNTAELSFTGLESAVTREVVRYEEEQRRIREEQERQRRIAYEAEQARRRAAQEAEDAAAQRRRDAAVVTGVVLGEVFRHSSSRSDDSLGSSGVDNSRDNDNLGSGSSGIDDSPSSSNDSLGGGSGGIDP